jgi:hypothetical protein
MRPKQSIKIQLVDNQGNSLPIGNVMVNVEFFVKGNYRYGFEAGRTDATGRLVVSYDDLDNRRRKLGNEFLMDYNTTLDECDPTVKIVILTEQELRSRREQVVRSFGREPEWSAAWPSNAQISAETKSVDLSAQTVNVKIFARKL